MMSFVQRHAKDVIGMLSGWDRVRFRGTLRRIANAAGLASFFSYTKVLLKDAGKHMDEVTQQVRAASEGAAETAGRPVLYVQDPSASKEELARSVAERDGVESGLVCVVKAVEPCWSFSIRRDRAARKLVLEPAFRKCLHHYHYFQHEELGLMHVRLQTWFPFGLRVCLNGREWLARQMDAAGVAYTKRDNCFTWVSDVDKAQALLEEQLATDWPKLLGGLSALAHPAHDALFGPRSAYPIDYYWSLEESEWASDVMFKDRASLAAVYPHLLRQATLGMGSGDVLRFLGRPVPAERSGGAGATRYGGQVTTDLKRRPEGVRVKHRVGSNSVKMYDKQQSVLRVETTINDARGFKVYRPKGGEDAKPDGKPAPLAWQALRKGVADAHRRAQVSQACNDRYLDALAAVDDKTPLKELAEPLCKPVSWKPGAGKAARARALNPLSREDAALLEAVSRGEWAVNGFRNKDLRGLLYKRQAKDGDATEARRRSAAVTRKLRLLRAHGLVRKVPRSHRYQLSDKGRQAVTALLAAREADTAELSKAA